MEKTSEYKMMTFVGMKGVGMNPNSKFKRSSIVPSRKLCLKDNVGTNYFGTSQQSWVILPKTS